MMQGNPKNYLDYHAICDFAYPVSLYAQDVSTDSSCNCPGLLIQQSQDKRKGAKPQRRKKGDFQILAP
jgi:hypothetical protein